MKFCANCGKIHSLVGDLCEACEDKREREDNDHPISQDDMIYPEEYE